MELTNEQKKNIAELVQAGILMTAETNMETADLRFGGDARLFAAGLIDKATTVIVSEEFWPTDEECENLRGLI